MSLLVVRIQKKYFFKICKSLIKQLTTLLIVNIKINTIVIID